jgi:hypothetical protein
MTAAGRAGQGWPALRLPLVAEVSGPPAPKFHRCSGTPAVLQHRHCCHGIGRLRRRGGASCPDDARQQLLVALRTGQSVPNPQSSKSTFSFASPLSSHGARPGALRPTLHSQGDMDGRRRLLLILASRCSEQIPCSKKLPTSSSSLGAASIWSALRAPSRSRYSARGHRHPAPPPSSSPTASDAGTPCASALLPWSPDSWPPHNPGSVR